jgi:uncharacterized membrane protein
MIQDGNIEKINVILYFQESCNECDEIVSDLLSLQSVTPHNLIKIDINSDESLRTAYQASIPVIEVGPYQLKNPITFLDLQAALGAAKDRKDRLKQGGNITYQRRVEQGQKITGTDKFSRWISNHYMLLFNVLVLIYIGLPFLAPVFGKFHLAGPAKVIYSLYSPLCHQLSFRSWFLFGEQAYYPRELAGIDGKITYEKLIGSNVINLAEARSFIGNEITGYKVALCERDVAIYSAILIFGLIFSINRRRIKVLRWYFWVIFGIIPIGLDGVSQLPSLLQNILPIQFPIRESTPILRTLTGGLFGLFTAWYLYPLIEETMQDTRRMVAKKMAYISQIQLENESGDNNALP